MTKPERVPGWVDYAAAYCLSQVAPVVPPERLDFAVIARAAKATQVRMGLSRPNGEAFRLKGRPERRKKGARSTKAPDEGSKA